MPNRSSSLDLVLPPRAKMEGLAAWLRRALCAIIRQRGLVPGARLPSVRALSRQCGAARGTIQSAFNQLAAEGYIEGRVGSGTFVRPQLPHVLVVEPAARPALHRKPGRISRRGARLGQSPFLRGWDTFHLQSIAFRANQPDANQFPTEVWSRLSGKRTRALSARALFGGDPFGYRPLREAIAAHVSSTRGVRCTIEQVMIVSGTQQALDLVGRLVLDPGDSVWMEDPGYIGATAVFRALEATIVPIGVDAEGLRVSEGISCAPKASLAFVSPTHQFPLGSTLSLERRFELLEWSRRTGAWIFEDDYDGEFRYAGKPLAALQSLDPDGNVIFSGTFSKMLFTSLRLGFVVLPASLVEPMMHARVTLDRFPSHLPQAVLADFIEEGHFSRHLRRMREHYAEQLNLVCSLSEREWGERLIVRRSHTGLQTTGTLRAGMTNQEFAKHCARERVELLPLSRYCLRCVNTSGLLIGFAAPTAAELKRGVGVVAKALKQY